MPVERRKRKGKREGRTKRKRLRAIAQKKRGRPLLFVSRAHFRPFSARCRLDRRASRRFCRKKYAPHGHAPRRLPAAARRRPGTEGQSPVTLPGTTPAIPGRPRAARRIPTLPRPCAPGRTSRKTPLGGRTGAPTLAAIRRPRGRASRLAQASWERLRAMRRGRRGKSPVTLPGTTPRQKDAHAASPDGRGKPSGDDRRAASPSPAPRPARLSREALAPPFGRWTAKDEETEADNAPPTCQFPAREEAVHLSPPLPPLVLPPIPPLLATVSRAFGAPTGFFCRTGKRSEHWPTALTGRPLA